MLISLRFISVGAARPSPAPLCPSAYSVRMDNNRYLTPAELADLKAEMLRDGLRMRAKFQAMKAQAASSAPVAEPITLPLDLPIWVNKGPLTGQD